MGLPAACGEGFAGVALATEAALQVGRQLVLERLEAEAEARAAGRDGGVASQALRCFRPLVLAAARAAALSLACATKKLVFVAAAARLRA